MFLDGYWFVIQGNFFRVEILGARPVLSSSFSLGLAGAFSRQCWDRLFRLLKLLPLAEGAKMDMDEPVDLLSFEVYALWPDSFGIRKK